MTAYSRPAPVAKRLSDYRLRLSKRQAMGWNKGAHTPSWAWHDGVQYFSISYLTAQWQVSRGVAVRWARARPHLTFRWKDRYLFCRADRGKPDADRPNASHPHAFGNDGVQYFTIPELARRRGVSRHAVRAWALRRPHLTILVGGRLYCRDDEYRPRCRVPDFIDREGQRYWSIPELARRRGLNARGVRRWALRRPHLTIRQNGALFCLDAEYAIGKRASPSIFRSGVVYYSIAELARRRSVTHRAARQWAARHSELTLREGRFVYARDEQYRWKRPDPPVPQYPAGPVPEIVLRTIAARRR